MRGSVAVGMDAGSMPSGVFGSPGITDDGLILGVGSVLARMTEGMGASRHLALDADRDRLLAMLSVARGAPVSPAEVLPAIEAASSYWQRGDKALANLRLVFAGLPRLADRSAVERLTLAADVLDGGLSPDALMKALWPDNSVDALSKYSIDQPRVPAGHGRESGRWTRDDWIEVAGADDDIDAEHHPSMLDALPHGRRDPDGAPTTEIGHSHFRIFDPVTGLPAGIGPGPFAGRSVPAGPGLRPTPAQAAEVDAIGRKSGCHVCGVTDPGTPSGRFYCDHQPPTALVVPGTSQLLYPHCLRCNCAQGGFVRHYKSK